MCECYGMEGDPMAQVSIAVVGHRIDEQNWEIIRLNNEIAELKKKAKKALKLAKVVDRHRKDRMHSDMKLGWELAKEVLRS